MQQHHPVNRRWTMKQRDWAVVFWIAFLSSCVGAFLLFGLLNPLDMIDSWADDYDIGLRLAYGLIFGFLYFLCFLACALTMFMIRTGPARGHSAGEGRRPLPNVRDPGKHNPDLVDEDWQ